MSGEAFQIRKLTAGEWREVAKACTCPSDVPIWQACEGSGKKAMRCASAIDRWRQIQTGKQ